MHRSLGMLTGLSTSICRYLDERIQQPQIRGCKCCCISSLPSAIGSKQWHYWESRLLELTSAYFRRGGAKENATSDLQLCFCNHDDVRSRPHALRIELVAEESYGQQCIELYFL